MKYAYPFGQTGEILISLEERADRRVHLTVAASFMVDFPIPDKLPLPRQSNTPISAA